MRKNVFGRKFKRDTNERKALFRSLMSSLILNERIETTEEKAKAIKGEVEKLITKAKKNILRDGENIYPKAQAKLKEELGSRFKDRNGGYTRISRLGKRFGDDATLVIIELTDLKKEEVLPAVVSKKEKKETKKSVRQAQDKKPEKKLSKAKSSSAGKETKKK